MTGNRATTSSPIGGNLIIIRTADRIEQIACKQQRLCDHNCVLEPTGRRSGRAGGLLAGSALGFDLAAYLGPRSSAGPRGGLHAHLNTFSRSLARGCLHSAPEDGARSLSSPGAGTAARKAAAADGVMPGLARALKIELMKRWLHQHPGCQQAACTRQRQAPCAWLGHWQLWMLLLPHDDRRHSMHSIMGSRAMCGQEERETLPCGMIALHRHSSHRRQHIMLLPAGCLLAACESQTPAGRTLSPLTPTPLKCCLVVPPRPTQHSCSPSTA